MLYPNPDMHDPDAYKVPALPANELPAGTTKFTRTDALHGTSSPDFFAAMSDAQGEMEEAPKDTRNPFFNSKYADLASVWQAIKKPFTSRGFSILQGVQTDLKEDRSCVVKLTTLLAYKDGTWLSMSFSAIPYKDTKEGRVYTSDPQTIAAAVTYLRRIALQPLLGVVADFDDDGGGGQQQRPAPERPAPPRPRTNTAGGGASAPQSPLATSAPSSAPPPSAAAAPVDAPKPDLYEPGVPMSDEQRKMLMALATKVGGKTEAVVDGVRRAVLKNDGEIGLELRLQSDVEPIRISRLTSKQASSLIEIYLERQKIIEAEKAEAGQ